MRIVQVIGTADAHIIYTGVLSLQFVYMSVETLELGEEVSLREVTVQDTHTVKLIECGEQVIVGVLYRHQVPWGYIASCTYHCKILHGIVIDPNYFILF